MEFDWTQLGMTGVLALLLVRETFAFLKSVKANSGEKELIAEYATHTSNLQNELKNLNAAITQLTHTLHSMGQELRSVQAEVRELRRDFDELKARRS